MLILTVPSDVTVNLARWPSSTGVDTTFHSTNDGRVDVCLKLVSSSAADLFETLVDDIVDHVAMAKTSDASLRAFVGRFAAWQRFLESGADGLGLLTQLGLYGELWFLSRYLTAWVGPERAISAWKGPLGANQDFQVGEAGIEVKCTATKLPLRVMIQSERQLDGVGMSSLNLCVLTFDVRDGHERTLPELVAAVRNELGDESVALQMFDERLIGLGYSDADEHRYANRSYTHRATRTYAVGSDFPRLIESQVPVGVADVAYSILVDACASFQVPMDTVRDSVVTHAGA
jgi:hypothetical protein